MQSSVPCHSEWLWQGSLSLCVTMLQDLGDRRKSSLQLQGCCLLDLLLQHIPLELLFPCPSQVTKIPMPQPPQPLSSPIPVLAAPSPVLCPADVLGSYGQLGSPGASPHHCPLPLGQGTLSSLGQGPAFPMSPDEFRLSLGQGFAFPVPTKCWDSQVGGLSTSPVLCHPPAPAFGDTAGPLQGPKCLHWLFLVNFCALCSSFNPFPGCASLPCHQEMSWLCAAAPSSISPALSWELGTGGDTGDGRGHHVPPGAQGHHVLRHSVPGAASGILSVSSRVYPVPCPRGAAAGGV